MKKLLIVAFSLLIFVAEASAQKKMLTGKIIEKATKIEMIGVSISEIDANNRLVNGTITNTDGEFVLSMKNENNKIRIQYVGFKMVEMKPDLTKRMIIAMEENQHTLKEATVTAKSMQNNGIANVPKRELSMAISHLDFGEEIENISTSSPADVLQGRISGLDIVSSSGAPGSGSQMRIRGTSTLTGNANPLIVLNDVIFDGDVSSSFDVSNATNEQFADLLCVNVDDIASIDVLKDAASCAIYGSKGANGVIKVNTKRGSRGKPIVKYSYKLTEKFQPKGMKMLTGDDYTMLMKQAYFNRTLSSTETYEDYERDEYSYNPSWSEYENFNNNIDWVDAVTQHGWTNDHYLSISGGGERATFSLSGGYLTESGTNIGQLYTKITNRSQLEYQISDRMMCTAEFQYTYSDNQKNYTDLLDIAYKKMPNVSIYAQDANGNNTDLYYNILSNSELSSNQKDLYNPVALAYLAQNDEKTSRILPTIRMQYYLLDPTEHYLKYSGFVSFDMNHVKTQKYLPAEVSNYDWDNASVNLATGITSEKLTVQTENKLEYQSRFSDIQTLLASMTWQTSSASSHYQEMRSYGHPDNSLTSANSTGYLSYLYNSTSSNRSVGLVSYFHYCLLKRYVLSGGLRLDGSTKFGKNQRWGSFPFISAKWIISDEKFMKGLSSVVSLFAVRPGWGITGNQPSSNYSQYSTYSADTYGYLGNSAVKPTQIQLTNLRWEKTTGRNLGIDLELWEGALVTKLDYYNNDVTDMLWPGYKISPTSGFSTLTYKNIGSMNNTGWEFEISANKLIKAGKFSMDLNMNLGNNKNTILEIDESIMNKYNDAASTIGNGTYLTRIQPNNSNGSIYGFRYKGVYAYSYDNYDKAVASGKTCPVAYDADGNVLTDYQGNPKQMYYRYKTTKYAFQGGDAMYEDINSDGSIDEYDVVYLGNSNPKLEGGFGFTVRYADLSLVVFSNFRYGNKIINGARMSAENMYTDNNQCASVNWRWRKEGDETSMPRAVYQQGYNWLGSDRYVEDGSFLRVKYLTLRYSLPSQLVKRVGLKSISTYLTMNNLYCFTNYSGTDPEVSVASLTGVATDNSKTPRSKDWTLGASITF